MQGFAIVQALRRPASVRAATLGLLGIAFVMLTGLVDGSPKLRPVQLIEQPWFPLANAWPGLLLAGALLLVTRRALTSFALAFLAQGVIYGVNALKVANLGTPLLASDFHLVGQMGSGGFHVFSGYLPGPPWLLAGIALALVLALVLLARREPPILTQRHRATRLMAGATLVIALGSVFAGSSIWRQVYNGRMLWMEPWSAAATRHHAGLVSSLVMFRLQSRQPQAKPDRLAALELISAYEPDVARGMQPQVATGELPDIVVVQSESFFDPRIVRGLEGSDFTPNLHALAARGASGALHVPTFGGGTIRTEFEVLTGLSLRYFQELQFPYLQLGYRSVPSLAQALNTHGYETIAIHGNDPEFWNRTAAFKALGFDRFVSRAEFPAGAPRDGKYMADRALTDRIMAELKDDGPPQFVFAISLEGHGPYDVDPADRAARDAIPVPDGLAAKDQLELRNYLYHLQRADAELGRLAHWLAQRKRPSRLLFYGDHLPGLADVYAHTGFVDGGDMLGEPDVWLLVDPKAPDRAPVRRETASWLLPATLLHELGLHDDGYFTLTWLVGDRLAALTAAPGAPVAETDPALHALDLRMRSANQLQLAGELVSLLPRALPPGTRLVSRPMERTHDAAPGARPPSS